MLSDTELARYDRQLRIEAVGKNGQEKLKKAKVLIAGMGGLGSPIAIYLAVAGVGYLRIIDEDRIEISNLNRQILHWDKDIGREKVTSAQEKLNQLNPFIQVEAISGTINERNSLQLADGCDLIVDALDNFPTRYLLNAAAIKLKIPFIYGGISELNGMVTTLIPGKTPCLRCIIPSAPPPYTFPVLGVVPGIIGTIQALEAIKFLTGMGELLAGRLLVFDGWGLSFREIVVKRRPDCPDCSSTPDTMCRVG